MSQRILILNWRDINNTSSGGAEVLTQEMAKRWVKLGNSVTQFSSAFKNSLHEEMVDGVKIIRKGNPDARYLHQSVHFKAFLYYIKHRNEFDIVLDEIHGLPFFTPLYVGKKRVALLCEVAGEIWDVVFPFPFNIIGRIAEKCYLLFYKNTPFLTISKSTKKDLLEFKIPDKNITILPMGITVPKNLSKEKKTVNPTLIFVGRLVRSKGIEDAIEVCKILKKDFPKIKLNIIGRGDLNYEKEIKNKIKKWNLDANIKFLGFVSQKEKFEELSRAHILLAPSVKEGFGLTVPEAGIVGTPSIAYDVEGLRDIILSMKNGILVDISPENMALQAKMLLTNNNLYKKLQDGAYAYAKSLSWDKTAAKSLEVFSGRKPILQ